MCVGCWTVTDIGSIVITTVYISKQVIILGNLLYYIGREWLHKLHYQDKVPDRLFKVRLRVKLIKVELVMVQIIVAMINNSGSCWAQVVTADDYALYSHSRISSITSCSTLDIISKINLHYIIDILIAKRSWLCWYTTCIRFGVNQLFIINCCKFSLTMYKNVHLIKSLFDQKLLQLLREISHKIKVWYGK